MSESEPLALAKRANCVRRLNEPATIYCHFVQRETAEHVVSERAMPVAILV
jgi:hypothetical protein